MYDFRRSDVAADFGFPSTLRRRLPSRHGFDSAMAHHICRRGRDVRDDAGLYGFMGGYRLDHRGYPDRTYFVDCEVGIRDREEASPRSFMTFIFIGF